MSIFALADPHLGHSVDKPMDVFGPAWERHAERMAENWRATVGADDWVLMPGDISWALKLEEARADLQFLHELPGTKVLLKGNHDYWWTSRSKVEAVLPPSLQLLQNDCVDLGGGVGVVGTRGWSPPTAPRATEQDKKIYAREVGRLELSVRAAGDRFERLIAMMHFPPIYPGLGPTDFIPILQEAAVEMCLYGHLHGENYVHAVEGVRDGIDYRCVAADAIDFTPVRIDPPGPER